MKTSTSSLTYHEKLQLADKEARATLLAAVVVTAVFWLSVFITSDLLVTFFGLPLWFWLSCIGGYVFSIVVVLTLVHWLFKDFDLEDVGEKGVEQ